MNRLMIVAASAVVLLSTAGCHKKADPSKAAEGVAIVNAHVPVKIGVALMLTKAAIVGDHAEFTYSSSFPGRTTLPPREEASLRGAMVQYACGTPGSREILDAGFNIEHHVENLDGQEMFKTLGTLAVCSNYDH